MLELFGMFVLALLPIIWLVAALCGLHMEAYKASVGALVVAFACAMLGWQMPLVNATTAALEGFAMALWPIVIVIIAAVFTYNLTVHTGAMEKIKAMLCSVSSDMRVLVILIGWCFGNFLEGMAGFGTAVAIPASIPGTRPPTRVAATVPTVSINSGSSGWARAIARSARFIAVPAANAASRDIGDLQLIIRLMI